MTGTPEWPSRRAILWFLVLLLVAGGLQSTVAAHFTFWNAQPDFPMALALAAALLSDAATGSLAGFAAGLVSGSIVGQTLGTFLVTRTLAGFVSGSFTARLYGANLGVVVLGVFTGSVVAEILHGLAAPRISLLHWIQTALLGGAMNALLALPLSALLRRCGWGRGARP
jgi:hypothetical protein